MEFYLTLKIKVLLMVRLKDVARNPGTRYFVPLQKKARWVSSNEVPRQSLPSEGYLDICEKP